MKYVADKEIDLQFGDNKIHFDMDEVKDLNLPSDLKLPEGLSEVGSGKIKKVQVENEPKEVVKKTIRKVKKSK